MTDITDNSSMFQRSRFAPETSAPQPIPEPEYEYTYAPVDEDDVPASSYDQPEQAYQQPNRPPTPWEFRKKNQFYLPFIKTVCTGLIGKKRRDAWLDNERHLKESRTENRHLIRIRNEATVRTGKGIRRGEMINIGLGMLVAGTALLATQPELRTRIPGQDEESPGGGRRPVASRTNTTTSSLDLDSKFAPAPSTTVEVEETVPPLPTTTVPAPTTTSIQTAETTTPAPGFNKITFSAGGLTCRGMWMIATMTEADRGNWFHAAERESIEREFWLSLNEERAKIIWPAIQQHPENKNHGGTIPTAVGTTALFPTICEPWKLPGEGE